MALYASFQVLSLIYTWRMEAREFAIPLTTQTISDRIELYIVYTVIVVKETLIIHNFISLSWIWYRRTLKPYNRENSNNGRYFRGKYIESIHTMLYTNGAKLVIPFFILHTLHFIQYRGVWIIYVIIIYSMEPMEKRKQFNLYLLLMQALYAMYASIDSYTHTICICNTNIHEMLIIYMRLCPVPFSMWKVHFHPKDIQVGWLVVRENIHL